MRGERGRDGAMRQGARVAGLESRAGWRSIRRPMMTPTRFALLAALCLCGCVRNQPDAVTPSSRPGRSAAAKWAPEKRPYGTVKDPVAMPYDSSRDAARKSEPQGEEERKSSLRIEGLKTGSLQPAKSDAREKPAAPVVDLGTGDAERKPPAGVPVVE